MILAEVHALFASLPAAASTSSIAFLKLAPATTSPLRSPTVVEQMSNSDGPMTEVSEDFDASKPKDAGSESGVAAESDSGKAASLGAGSEMLLGITIAFSFLSAQN